MFLDDIDLVDQLVDRYGLVKPLADLGGLERPTVADYAITLRTGRQRDRYIQLPGRPFDHLDPDYLVLNPEHGDPPIEALPRTRAGAFGTVVCLNVVEHVVDPFAVFAGLAGVLAPGGLLIVSTVFSFPYHPSPRDYWRFSPDCLRMLAERVGLAVLEADWRLQIHGGMGIQEIHTGEPQEIRSVYVCARKP